MFGNLVESNSHQGDLKRRGSFFLGTLAVYALFFLAIGVGSIYAYNTHVESRDLRLVALVIPAETSGSQTQPHGSAPKSASRGNDSRAAAPRTSPVQTSTDPRLAANGVSTSTALPDLPVGPSRIGIPGTGSSPFGEPGDKGIPGDGGNGVSNKIDEIVKEAPPPMKIETSKPPAVKPIKSLGVVNGLATYLPKPAYTAIARAAHASGPVTVQVLIDENGRVISAHALNGHPLLLQPSVQAALQARFTPTLLSNQPVKASGVITYNFVMQ
jgi:TonB family protein